VFKKNICDGVGVQDESIGTPLYSPLFWLDNIFKAEALLILLSVPAPKDPRQSAALPSF
jgi:hypothetical protein